MRVGEHDACAHPHIRFVRKSYLTNAFGTGRSDDNPKPWIEVPAVKRWAYHVAFDARKTVASNLPPFYTELSDGHCLTIVDPEGSLTLSIAILRLHPYAT